MNHQHMLRCWNAEKRKMCPVINTQLEARSVFSLFNPDPGRIAYNMRYTGLCDDIEFEAKAEDVMMCSGVLDETGQYFIYEGDIVERVCLDENCTLTHRGVVLFNTTWGTFQIREGRSGGIYESYNPPMQYGSFDPVMVIPLKLLGNICATPELLAQ